MTTLRSHGWRLLLLASGAFMMAGGPRHPESDAGQPLREELATMTAHPDWVPAHVLVLVSTVLLALGLWAARASGTWPWSTRRSLTVGAIAVSVYVVEAAFHLAAVVDSHALAHGGAAPVAMTHVGLSLVLYPLTGLAIAGLALSYGRALGGWRRVVAGVGVVAGLAQATSVPLSLVLPDAELSPVFAAAGILTAVWAIGTGAAGVRSRRRAARDDAATVRAAATRSPERVPA
ncbi:MAG TPA: hypothetical protein VFI44_08815 [Ornithinibacter sp.]|nr:hypothetical protein [Ornithinibacter sp.]